MRTTRTSQIPARRLGVGALLTLLLLAGCSVNFGGADEPGWLAPRSEPSATTEARPSVPRPTGRHLGDWHRFPGGLEVRVHRLTTAVPGGFPTPSADGEPAGDPYTLVSIRLVNHGVHQVEAELLGRLRYGPGLTDAAQVMVEGAPGVALAPGESVEHDFGFVVADEHRDDVVFELNLGDSRTVYFLGTVRTR